MVWERLLSPQEGTALHSPLAKTGAFALGVCKPNLPLHVAVTTDFVFVRYIGNPRLLANETFLDAWAQQLATWLQRGITPYVFCHCPFEEHSPALCAALYRRVQALASIDPLPWQPEKEVAKPHQATLFD
ncbi:MAG TPA: DUF72 domain-containing protein [Ktedonobacteraceae bacterium]|nr:DUF72 domain-containing protein [Ktedonobacteraceae bacterium]